ncbi:MAG: hypothetical protein K2N72_11875, partial [Oscillospiraceae bacterium]|nr:hypothetical protein [Oscillospiraceae bacterium]
MGQGIKILGIITSLALIAVGIFLPVPPKKINTYSYSNEGYHEYVGGDAYNIQIEASLRGGIIAGRTAAKAILISAGVLELFLVIALSSISESILLHLQRNNKTIVKAMESHSANSDDNTNNIKKLSPEQSKTALINQEAPIIKNTGDKWICPD